MSDKHILIPVADMVIMLQDKVRYQSEHADVTISVIMLNDIIKHLKNKK